MQQTLAAHNGLRLQDLSPEYEILAQFTHHGCEAEYLAGRGDWASHVNLSEVDPNSVRIEMIGRAPWVVFKGRNSQHVTTYIDPTGKLPTYDSETGGFSLDSKEYAESFLKALKHAVMLCGGKPSTF